MNNNTLSSSAGYDRFIPNRNAMDISISHYNLLKENNNPQTPSTTQTSNYKSALAQTMFNKKEKIENFKILALKDKAPAPPQTFENHLKVVYSHQVDPQTRPKTTRHIPKTADKVLDAPGFEDNYYLNLLSWSSTNHVAVALSDELFIWNASSADITRLAVGGEQLGNSTINTITSVKWCESGDYLAVGFADASVHLYDVEKGIALRTLLGHNDRVGSLAWNSHILSSGSLDCTIHNSDVRAQNHLVSRYEAHEGEVCGLAWSKDGSQLASGANDNTVMVWDVNNRLSQPKFKLTAHSAAVKAVAWCPFQQYTLASGGGTADRHIKIWNTRTGALLNSIDTQSQVCSIVWSKKYKELVSSHGFSKNQLSVWKYPSMVKIADLEGHDSRVLAMDLSPDGSTVCSAAGDETIRFWKVWRNQGKSVYKKSAVRSLKRSSSSAKKRLSINKIR